MGGSSRNDRPQTGGFRPNSWFAHDSQAQCYHDQLKLNSSSLAYTCHSAISLCQSKTLSIGYLWQMEHVLRLPGGVDDRSSGYNALETPSMSCIQPADTGLWAVFHNVASLTTQHRILITYLGLSLKLEIRIRTLSYV